MASHSAAWAGERVPERSVVDHWLAAEARNRSTAALGNETVGARDNHGAEPLDHRGGGRFDGGRVAARERDATTPGDIETAEGEAVETAVGALDDDEALDALLRRKPGAAAFLWRARPVEWSRIELCRAEFERLRFVDGPDGLGWRALAPSGNLVDGARRIAAGDRAALEAETGVDVERVCSMAETLADGGRLAPLVLTKRRGRGPPAVADGNHRATAIALHLLRTDEYRSQRAYLGIGANPVLRPVRQQLCGLLGRLRPGPRW